ncbi:Nif3-like dinuclear metal center hexameric protein [Calditrichota bacterium GD2]
MEREKLLTYLNRFLKCDEFNDISPNGLQVEGKKEIKKIVSGVSACVELFEKALDLNADTVLVHHGIIWNFERPVYRGSYKKRVKLLLENDLNLLAYHLPLDAHEIVGNNIQIAKQLELLDIQPFGDYKGAAIGFSGEIEPISRKKFFNRIKTLINENALIFPYGPEKIRSVGIISGAAQKEIQQAVLKGLDVFITGEVSEHIMHYAREEGIHFVAAGHYATERYGIIAISRHLKSKFNIEVEFVDIPNPV